MKHKLLMTTAGILLIASTFIIMGAYGSYEWNKIGTAEFLVRSGIGLVMLAGVAVISAYIGGKEGVG